MTSHTLEWTPRHEQRNAKTISDLEHNNATSLYMTDEMESIVRVIMQWNADFTFPDYIFFPDKIWTP